MAGRPEAGGERVPLSDAERDQKWADMFSKPGSGESAEEGLDVMEQKVVEPKASPIGSSGFLHRLNPFRR